MKEISQITVDTWLSQKTIKISDGISQFHTIERVL